MTDNIVAILLIIVGIWLAGSKMRINNKYEEQDKKKAGHNNRNS
jgi:glucose uptake protein GlcU